jgi:hypothetical protein
MFVHNDLQMLRTTLIHEILWVNQICILDLNSTDGTEEFCNSILRTQDCYIKRDKNTIPELGFAEAKNSVLKMSKCDWAYFSGANSCMDWTQHDMIKSTLYHATSDILSIKTINIPYLEKYVNNSYSIEKVVADFKNIKYKNPEILENTRYKEERHRNFIRKNSNIEIKGYIHEEPFLGDLNCSEIAMSTDIQRFHFSGWTNDKIRQMRYSWMLRHAAEYNKDLQKYTNRWWYDNYFISNRERLGVLAEHFKAARPEEIKFYT